MGTYNLPRNVKGEGRILFIFTGKSLIYTAIGAVVGLPFYWLFSALKLTMVGIVFFAIFALIGFIIGTFKMPDVATFDFAKKNGGENIDDVIKRFVKFKMKKNKIYVYTKEETEDDK